MTRNFKGQLEVFDSLGTRHQVIRKLFTTEDVIFNQKHVQSRKSNLCGLFCIFFAHLRVFHFDESLEEIITDYFYTEKTKRNDRIVTNFFKTGKYELIPD